jgi:hypothetical protein
MWYNVANKSSQFNELALSVSCKINNQVYGAELSRDVNMSSASQETPRVL